MGKKRKLIPKLIFKKEILKIRVEINEIDTKKTIEKINGTKSWLFKRKDKIDKPQTRLRKKDSN